MSAALSVVDLSVRYGDVPAVQGIGLEVGVGEIVTVIGPNGAGKSTTLNAIMGVLRSSGSVRLEGSDLGTTDVEDRVARGLSLVPERRELFGQMSVEDNLLLGGYARRRSGMRGITAALPEIYSLFPRLRERRRQIASTLSGGERQMLAIGRALMARPRVLLLDEPSLGLAPRVVREVLETVSTLRDLGVSVLLVEQNARAALKVSDRAYVLEMGRIALQGDSADLVHDPRIVASYLGAGPPSNDQPRRELTNKDREEVQ